MSQKEYIGSGAINKCGKILERFPGRKILLVTGSDSYKVSGAKKSLAPFLSGRQLIVFNKLGKRPTAGNINYGIKLFKKNNPDLVIAVGGGNAIDTAKLINFYGSDKKSKPLIAIPTTAGSGSEATHFAVAYKNAKKYSVGDKRILPDIAIVDSDLTISLSPRQRAISGMDALSQAIESYWSVNSTKSSVAYARKAIKLILPNFIRFVKKNDKSSREAMARAAHLSGKAINITKTTAPHAASYPLTAYFEIPHGHAVALTLGKFFVVNSNLNGVALNERRGKRYLEKKMKDICVLFKCKLAEDFNDKWNNLLDSIGLEHDLRKVGLKTRFDIDMVINNVDMERLGNNPVKIDRLMMRKVLGQFN